VGALVLGLLTLAACQAGAPSPSAARTIGVGLIPFAGYAPLYVAADNRLCAPDGFQLRLVEADSQSALDTLMVKGDAEVGAYANTSLVFAAAGGVPLRAFLELDQSLGADGIVAAAQVTSIEQMVRERSTLAADETDVEYFLFMYAAQRLGFQPGQFNHSPLKGPDALSAFVTGRVDVVGESQPLLSRALQRPGAHVLVSSRQYPGLVSDQFAATDRTLSGRRGDLVAFARCWYRTLDWIGRNQGPAVRTMARHLGIGESDLRALLPDIAWPDRAAGREFLTSGLSESLGFADDFYGRLGQLAGKPVPAERLVSDVVVGQLGGS
jgi:NitT/TauT family transport system substrate-binding protein